MKRRRRSAAELLSPAALTALDAAIQSMPRVAKRKRQPRPEPEPEQAQGRRVWCFSCREWVGLPHADCVGKRLRQAGVG